MRCGLVQMQALILSKSINLLISLSHNSPASTEPAKFRLAAARSPALPLRSMSEPPKPKKDENTRRFDRRAVALRENLKRRKAQARGRVQAENADPESRIPGKDAQSRKDSDTE